MRHWRTLVVLAAALVTLSIALFTGDSEPASLSPALVREAPAPLPLERMQSPDEQPAGDERQAERAESEPAPTSASTGPAETLASVEELAALLDTDALDRALWVRAARALASSLNSSPGMRAVNQLTELLDDPELGQRECIAAAELLRLLTVTEVADHAPALDLAARARLRSAQSDLAHPAEALAAARVLAGAGDWSDALQLIDDLLWSEEPERRADAAWCLETNRRPSVAEYLANNCIELEQSERIERVLATLAVMCGEDADLLLSEGARAQLFAVASPVLASGEPDRVRVLSYYLGRLDPDGAAAVLFGTMSSTRDLESLRDLSRLVAMSAGVESLEALAGELRAETDPLRRTALAEGLLASGGAAELPADIGPEAVRLVSLELELADSSADRRRAVAVLAGVREAPTAEALLRALRFDGDARVRSAAAHALANFPVELLRPLRVELERVNDPSALVRKALEHLRRRAARD